MPAKEITVKSFVQRKICSVCNITERKLRFFRDGAVLTAQVIVFSDQFDGAFVCFGAAVGKKHFGKNRIFKQLFAKRGLFFVIIQIA